MEDTSEPSDWAVVGSRKEKKGSPKTQNRKGTKRTSLQRSTSSNQMSNRRKVVVSSDDTSSRPTTRSTKQKQPSSDLQGIKDDDGEEKEDETHEKLSRSIEDVSSKIQLLNIREDHLAGDSEKRKEVTYVETLASGVPSKQKSLTSQALCDLCRNFAVDVAAAETHFQTRALINTGSACFCNCVMQALFAVDVFQRLLFEIIARLGAEHAEVDERMRCWREVVELAKEFHALTEIPAVNAPASATKTDASTVVKNGKGPIDAEVEPHAVQAARASSRRTAVAATALMPALFTTFIQKMDGISGVVRHTTVGANGTSKATGKKNNQQDAVEFLTFLLDALHEEIIHTEAEDARLAEEARAAALAREQSSPQLGGALSGDDFDLIAMNSRQNSFDMVIALTRQNSLNTEQRDTGAAVAVAADDGWSTVGKSAKAKVKAVVVDAVSKERADSASSASVISRLFHATLRSEVVYKVKKMNSVTFQRFHCLTLDVGTGGNTGTISLDTCLATYFAEESIDEGKVKKQLKLDSLPEVFILQLSRFSYDYHKLVPIKILKNVEYPAVLDLSPQILSDELKQRNDTAPRYQLQAVVLHHGKKATGGHYSAFTLEVQRRGAGAGAEGEACGGSSRSALRDTHIWRSVNDAKVSTVSELQVLGAQDLAYILFYSRVRTH